LTTKEIRDADIAQAVRSVKDQCASLEAAYDKVADTYSGFQDRDNLSGFKNPGAINRGAVKKAYLRYFPDDDSREG
jgi:hypothetical protein